MEHNQAMTSGVAESYVLGQLSAAEADAYEEHFFDCEECAEEVRLGMAILDGGRRMMLEDRAKVVPIAEHRNRRAWLPAAVAALLILGISAPLLLRQLRQPEPSLDIVSAHTLRTQMRAAGEPILVVASGDVLFVDVVGDPSYSRYELRVHDSKGKVVLTRAVTPEQTRESLSLVLRGWSAGTYELAVVGVDPSGKSAEVERHPFKVRD
jgi:hypothetical protein